VAVIIYARCNEVVAYLPGVTDAVNDKAKQGGRRAEAILRAHRSPVAGAAYIEVTRGRTDSFVSLVDPPSQAGNNFKPNAMAIEYGRSGARGRGASQGIFAVTGAFGGLGV
jgi:hypothetical protein